MASITGMGSQPGYAAHYGSDSDSNGDEFHSYYDASALSLIDRMELTHRRVQAEQSSGHHSIVSGPSGEQSGGGGGAVAGPSFAGGLASAGGGLGV